MLLQRISGGQQLSMEDTLRHITVCLLSIHLVKLLILNVWCESPCEYLVPDNPDIKNLARDGIVYHYEYRRMWYFSIVITVELEHHFPGHPSHEPMQ